MWRKESPHWFIIMVQIKVNVIADLSKVLTVSRFSKNNQPILLQTAANRYLQFLKKRFIRLSAGGGEWPKLKRITVLRKRRRGVADNPRAILREYDALLSALQSKILGKKVFVGFTRNRSHPRGKSVFFLAKIHTRGSRTIPSRRVVGLPDTKTRNQMTIDIRNTYNRVIRSRRR